MGQKFNKLKLGQDLYEAKQAQGYGELFQVRLVKKNQLNPFRAYLHYNNGWWPLLIELNTYPIVTKPKIKFESRIPPCPKHPKSWHPNVYNDGRICWGDGDVFPEMGVVGLLSMLYGMLHNPNHQSPVPGRCNVFSDVAESAVSTLGNILDQLANAEKNYNR